ncbi:MAG: hypothetical protein M5U09_17700 [Gammaproteobacteria bacterium]|nr:hypothetical protein [Gammaproteobacteria bacterium]
MITGRNPTPLVQVTKGIAHVVRSCERSCENPSAIGRIADAVTEPSALIGCTYVPACELDRETAKLPSDAATSSMEPL